MKPMRHYVVTVYGPPPGGNLEWFEQLREKRGAPAGTYGVGQGAGGPAPILGYTVASVAESYTGPYVLGQSWIYPTRAAAEKEARARRRHGLELARRKRAKRSKRAVA
jgi:hypothetical protein